MRQSRRCPVEVSRRIMRVAEQPALVSFFDGFANLARYRAGQEVAMEGHARIANAGT
jgi:hypothetical protein